MNVDLAWLRKRSGYSFPWMMRRPDENDPRPILCSVCPCGGKWYINALCQTGVCDDPPEYLQYGQIVFHSEPGEPFLYEMAGNDVQRAVNVEQLTEAESKTHSFRWDFAGKRITAIRHHVESVPFSCTATAMLRVDGSPVTLGNPTFTCESGVPRWAGDITLGYDGGVANANILFLSSALKLEAGTHFVDLRIMFDDGQGRTQHYDSRLIMRCWSMGTPQIALSDVAPGPWDIYITPFKLSDLGDHSNQILNEITGTLCVFGQMQVDLGPYDEYEQAAAVVEEFDGLLTAMAKCLCPKTCHFGGAGNIDITGYYESPVSDALYEGNQSVDFEGPGSCDYAPVKWDYHAVGDEHCHVSVNGVAINAGDSGTLYFQPCQAVEVRYSVDEAGERWFSVFSNDWDTIPPWTPCPLDDEESPYYHAQLDYDPVTNLGIPANSMDYADYFGEGQ